MNKTGIVFVLCCLFATLSHGQVTEGVLDDSIAELMLVGSENGDHPVSLEKLTEDTAGVQKHAKQRFRVFPSPENDHLFISTPINDPIQKIRLFDSYEKLVHTGMPLAPGASIIDLSTLHPGVYLLEITQAGAVGKQRFVKW